MVIVIAAVITAVAVATGILAIYMVRKREKGEKQIVNYRAFLIMGIIWVPFSVVLMAVSFILQIPFYTGFPLFALGLVYLIIGLKNRNN